MVNVVLSPAINFITIVCFIDSSHKEQRFTVYGYNTHGTCIMYHVWLVFDILRPNIYFPVSHTHKNIKPEDTELPNIFLVLQH